jgi:hypothetical protein
MFLGPIRQFAMDNGVQVGACNRLDTIRDSTVVLLTDHLSEDLILVLKNNGNKIVGINVTDSSYISGKIRYAKSLALVDLIFMVSGVPINNTGSELSVDDNFNVSLVDKPFLDDDNWRVFDQMRRAGKLQSLPYIPWTPIPEVPHFPWSQRSQKAILRGGGHARRFVAALFLLKDNLLDPNSGFVLSPYFTDDMNLQFRYCEDCRREYRSAGRAKFTADRNALGCNSTALSVKDPTRWDLSDLGQWNNRCPRSFFWMAEQFQKRHGKIDMGVVEGMLNARWLHPNEHQAMLGRILFTSDLKWAHSIFMPQRFWEGASAGCINVLPSRTMNQEYFPKVRAAEHYLVYDEMMKDLPLSFGLDPNTYDSMSKEMRQIYETWVAPSFYAMNSNLLSFILNKMREL